MKKLFMKSLLFFCCSTLFLSNLTADNTLNTSLENYNEKSQIEYYLTHSSATPSPPTVTVADIFDTDGDGNTTEPVFNAEGAPLIQYCANTDFANVPIAMAQGEPGAIFFWYYDSDPLADPDFTVNPPTGVQQVFGAGAGDQYFNSGLFFTQSDSIYVVQNINDCTSDYTFVELIINDLPIINISPTYICYDGMGNVIPATITPIVIGGDGNYTYNWIIPAGYTGPTNEADITTSIVGFYILTVTDGNGCESTNEVVVIGNLVGDACDDNNPATINDVYNNNCECLGTPVAQNYCVDVALTITDNPIANGIYDAIQTVTSSGLVANGSTVSHIAGEAVILNPGFRVEPNVYFVADIISCPMSRTQPVASDKIKK